jgi:RNA methyltransferase, TrmH family
MSQIQSPHNHRLKAVRHLHTKRGRARSGLFLAEGEDLFAAAAQAGRQPVEGYRLAGCELGNDDFHEVERSALASVSALGSGTRVIATYEQRWGAPTGPLCVYLHRVGDPGNVGTVLRSAEAFGASCVALGPGCADPHGPGEGELTLLVGSERDGLPAEILTACDRVARIPIATDSLNAAMAATVALYEMTRQPHGAHARLNDTVPAS